MSSKTEPEPEYGDFIDHDNDEEFYADQCFDAGEHTAVTQATINFGRNRHTQITELCIHCNLRLRSWKEYTSDFTF